MPKRREVIDGKVRCTLCQIPKTFDQYHLARAKGLGIDSKCKECRSKLSKKKTQDKYSTLNSIEDLPNELWRFIPETGEIYAVSNKGRIRSFDRSYTQKDGKNLFIKGVLLKPSLDQDGYRRVHLRNENGIEIHRRVCRLVAIMFIPNPENLSQVNHKDLVKTNDDVDNLEWMTGAQNQRHRYLNYETKTNLQGVHMTGNMYISTFNIDNIKYTLGKSKDKVLLQALYIKTVSDYENLGILPQMYIYCRNKKTKETIEVPEDILLKTLQYLEHANTEI